ncbi:MFS transporter, DHA1 family, inner membrane transport protein [Micromonospora phaseoli]|uniref:MFS transporter, DHA1 family, inner membrane transport protein n=1 Tax=Micromonospora phaseoli TaxID=1144548 RepID=A0A1H6VJL4_9ACTN|nr:MFS transporter [Micromonospora phaseoli]PZV93660.1 DHA1 family inner membrane transport protein [Micromonospora phaseoli]GIJ79141.1 MFS transporter [Micromonospora phaseoli]SEJ00950.1 MFS transporter, DHA1 family, inner membrane transport protein [Micromonospora phaseoli]
MKRWRAVGALIGLSGGTFLYTTAEALPIGLLLPMAVDLAVPPSQVGMLVTAYGAVVMVASVPLTALVRRVPRRRLLSVLLAGFVVSTAVTVLTDTFALVLAARMATAATHAVFWAVVVQAAAELFRPGLRGRVVAVVFAGGNIALALGVPAGTWLGERAGWRASFLAVAGLGAIVLVVTASLLPSTRPEEGHAARGATPDVHRFWLLVTVAVLATAGAIAAYTYVALFVTEVSGFSASAVGAILLARGIASVLGILAVGAMVDRSPWHALTATVALQAVALLGLYAFGQRQAVTVGLIALSGLAFAAFTAALGGLVLQVAPGRSDLAAATVSAAVNVGITGGAFFGGLALPSHGVRGAVLIGALLGVVALVAALGERLIRPAASTPPPGVPATRRQPATATRGPGRERVRWDADSAAGS